MDFDATARELIRALRGRRSQVAFSRRLGYRSNVAHSWETGRNFPTASQTLRIAQRSGVDVRAALQRFYRNPPAWLARADPTSKASVARLLNDWVGHTPISHVARAAGLSRFAVARALGGTAQPRLPDFLRLLEAASLRVLDFIAVLVDPSELPSVAQAWRRLEAARAAAYDTPWTLAVIRALELSDYRALPAHEPGFIARRLGLPIEVERACLALLEDSGQIELHEGRYRIVLQPALDTRRDPERGKNLRKFWAEQAIERFGEGDDRVFSYIVFGVSAQDHARIRELHRAYFRELRAVVAESQPVERVVLANVQLVRLDG